MYFLFFFFDFKILFHFRHTCQTWSRGRGGVTAHSVRREKTFPATLGERNWNRTPLSHRRQSNNFFFFFFSFFSFSFFQTSFSFLLFFLFFSLLLLFSFFFLFKVIIRLLFFSKDGKNIFSSNGRIVFVGVWRFHSLLWMDNGWW